MKTYNQLITELSARTLARYIGRASSQVRASAIKHGQDLLKGKRIGYRKFLDPSKKPSSPLSNFERMYNREQGIKQAARKLAGKAEEQRLDNIIRSTVDAGPKNKPFPARDLKKDPLGIDYLKKIAQDYRKRMKKK